MAPIPIREPFLAGFVAKESFVSVSSRAIHDAPHTLDMVNPVSVFVQNARTNN